MIEHAINFYFVNDSCLAIFLTVGCLFCECLDCKLFSVFKALTEVYGGKITLANLPHCPKKIMKTTLIDNFPEFCLPLVQVSLLIRIEFSSFISVCLNSQS